MIRHDGTGDWFEDRLIADSAVEAHREIERVVRDLGWEPDPRDRQVTRIAAGEFEVSVRVTRAGLSATT